MATEKRAFFEWWRHFSMALLLISTASGCGNTKFKAKRADKSPEGHSSGDASQQTQPVLSPRPLPQPSTPPDSVQKSGAPGIPVGPQPPSSASGTPPIQFPSPPATSFDIPKLVTQMTWTAKFFNNRVGKIFTGYDGVNSYRVLVEFGPIGLLPPTIILNPFQLQALYSSPEYLAVSKEKTKSLSFEVDPTLMSVKVIEESPLGRTYELVTLQKGDTMANGRFETLTLPLLVKVSGYGPEQVTMGRKRYVSATEGNNPSPSCASCHSTVTGADHSPYLMTQFSDEGLLSSIETGVNSDDGYRLKVLHKQTFSDPLERLSIVPYLRTLDPKLTPDQQPTALTRLLKEIQQ